MRSIYWQRYRVVVLSMGISVLLHLLLFSWSYLQPPELEKRMFRVQRVPPIPFLSARAFRVPHFKPAVPGEIEMLRRGGGPAHLPEIALPPAAALGDLRDEMERMLMPADVVLSLLQPGAKPGEFTIEPAERIPTAELGIPREAPIDLRRDLLTLEDLDRSGRFRAVVVVDPKDKRNVRGYVHIPRIEKRSFTDDPRFDFSPPVHVSFATYMNRHTGIKLSIDEAVEIRSPDLLDVPILFFSADSLRITEGVDKQDVEFLAEYIRKSGFLVMRSGMVYMQLMTYLNRTSGSRFSPVVLPSEYPIFHSFYDLNRWLLMGIEFEGRLVGITPMQAPVNAIGTREKWINTLVFAMTQPGGFTYATVKEPEGISHLVLTWGTDSEEVDPGQLEVSMDGGAPLRLEGFSEAARYDGIVFHNLASGKHRLWLRYGDRTIDREVRLRGGRVTTLKIGVRRIFWITNLYLKQRGEESYEEWQARHPDSTFIDSREISLSQ